VMNLMSYARKSGSNKKDSKTLVIETNFYDPLFLKRRTSQSSLESSQNAISRHHILMLSRAKPHFHHSDSVVAVVVATVVGLNVACSTIDSVSR
jgi:hypothetical protein